MNSMKKGKRIIQPYDICVVIFGLWNMTLFFGRGLIDGEYDWSALTVLSLSVFYFALRELKRIGDRQLDILLIVCSFLCEMILWHYIVDPAISFGLGFLIEERGTLASFSLFILCLAATGYCRKQKRGKRYLYMVMAVLGSLCLFISGEATAVYLGATVFLLLPLMMRPTAGRIRRVMELICMYLGLLGFIPLADFWLGLFRVELIYTLEDSIYLYLIFSVAAVGFLNWWDKRREEQKRLIKEFRELCRYLLAGILTGLFLWDGYRGDGTMAQCMGKYGAAGCVLLVMFILAAAKRLYEKYLRRESVKPVFGVVSAVYLMQSAFLPQQAVMSLGYLVFLSTALQYKKREKGTAKYEKKRQKISKVDCVRDVGTPVVSAGDCPASEGDGTG